jgi:hypothetical protein
MEGLNGRYGVRGKYFLLLFLPFRYLLVQSEEKVGRTVLVLSSTGIMDSNPTGVTNEFFTFFLCTVFLTLVHRTVKRLVQ